MTPDAKDSHPAADSFGDFYEAQATGQPGATDAFWMPFTANRQFKKAPRMLTRADGMYFTDDKSRQVLDGIAGLWCVNAGHNRPRIVQAIQQQAATGKKTSPAKPTSGTSR